MASGNRRDESASCAEYGSVDFADRTRGRAMPRGTTRRSRPYPSRSTSDRWRHIRAALDAPGSTRHRCRRPPRGCSIQPVTTVGYRQAWRCDGNRRVRQRSTRSRVGVDRLRRAVPKCAGRARAPPRAIALGRQSAPGAPQAAAPTSGAPDQAMIRKSTPSVTGCVSRPRVAKTTGSAPPAPSAS